jgi:hypothetical protein
MIHTIFYSTGGVKMGRALVKPYSLPKRAPDFRVMISNTVEELFWVAEGKSQTIDVIQDEEQEKYWWCVNSEGNVTYWCCGEKKWLDYQDISCGQSEVDVAYNEFMAEKILLGE